MLNLRSIAWNCKWKLSGGRTLKDFFRLLCCQGRDKKDAASNRVEFYDRSRRVASLSRCRSGKQKMGASFILNSAELFSALSDVTRIPQSIDAADSQAAKDLLPMVYEELRKLAAVRLDQVPTGRTFPPAALVHEA